MNDAYLAAFASALETLIDSGRLPAETVGDLADLLGTSQKLCALLEDLAKKGAAWSPAQLKRKLFEIQIMVEQDLPMIVADLAPPLQTLSGESLRPISTVEPT